MIAGKYLRISVEGKTIYHATNCTFDSNMSITSIATKDTPGEEGLPDIITWNLSADSVVTNAPEGATPPLGTKNLLDYHLAGTLLDIEFTTNVEGDFIIAGQAYVESVNIAAPVQGQATFTASFKGNGGYTVEAVPAP